jgi:hypothetical protein
MARAEVTGKNPNTNKPHVPLMAYSVAAFCVAHSISAAMFYKMLAAGIGPQTMKAGTRTLISFEAAARWRAEREAATAAAAAASLQPETRNGAAARWRRPQFVRPCPAADQKEKRQLCPLRTPPAPRP